MSTSPKPVSLQTTLGWWSGETASADEDALAEALRRVDAPVYLVEGEKGLELGTGGVATLGGDGESGQAPLRAFAPACRPEFLGDRSFCEDHGLRYAYVSGAMANGIGSTDICIEMARAGMAGFFGAAGLPLDTVEAAIDRLQQSIPDLPHGVNLIHSPDEQDLESALVDLLLRRGVRLIEASAFLGLTPHVVRYRVSGLSQGPDGSIQAANRIVAKVSRVEVATRFLSPPPEKILRQLVQEGSVTEEQAKLAEHVPLAQDITAEADSGGHTDNRPALALLPTLLSLRDRIQAQHGHSFPLRVGAAGGIATPSSAAAAYAMGAAFVMVGSINQSCVESGSCDDVRKMLAEAGQADVVMAPAADMFEMGVKVQVLKRGTMFAMRGSKLYDIYRACDSMETIPAADRAMLEKTIFRDTLENVWASTREFFLTRDPRQVEKAEADPKHKMALVFRSYLGLSSRWANAGEPDRKVDYQVWCGPAMGAFNEWTKDSFLAAPSERRVALVARNLLHGAAVLTRASTLRSQGVPPSPALLRTSPLTDDRLQDYLQ